MFSILSKFDTSLSCSWPFFTNSSVRFSSSSNAGTSAELNNCNPTPSPFLEEFAPFDDHVPPPPRRSDRVIEPPPYLKDYHCFSAISSLYEPSSYREAGTDPNWQEAMTDELCALEKTHTWDLVDLPIGKTPIGCKWVYKIKTHFDGSVERYKALLVAKGIGYEETFAPMARLTSVRSLLVVAIIKTWSLFQMDVKNAFLNGDLEEEVYMRPPPGYAQSPNQVCLLRQALYGLKQAPRAWFVKFSSTITKFGFTSSPHDSALFTRHTDRGIVLLPLYVDDMIITGDDSIGFLN
ncbi:hypothetical protein Scep_004422 [Stephania cephalantha]|uniref:Reverse transcriptase Ty1/copia-type domain-containing protein n=1 Tax=Stephania cephalantha TaxID=152367 RepID=A0AAP0KTV8_9MAGN